MSGMRLTLRSVPLHEIDATGLGGKLLGDSERGVVALDEVRRWQLPILGGRRSLLVGDWFTVEPDPGDRVVIRGDLRRFHGLGTEWRRGELIVEGDVGHALATGMSGGTLRLRGSAGNGVCQHLRGGMVTIDGNVGDDLGGPLVGRRGGMRGGTVVVSGNAGQCAGYRLRRGTLVILGDCGDALGCDLVAGTILVGGRVSGLVAPGMRRGTIFLGSSAEISSVRFSQPRPVRLGIATLLAGGLPSAAASLIPNLREPLLRRLGDLTAGGMGEIWQPLESV